MKAKSTPNLPMASKLMPPKGAKKTMAKAVVKGTMKGAMKGTMKAMKKK